MNTRRSSIRETAVLFGAAKTLVGVVTDPVGVRCDTACVFLNAGFTSRVGPQRTYVVLARRLAAIGVTSLRFDHSGIGDSAGRVDSMSFADSTIDEAKQAISYLAAARGARRFLLMGICWGADNALRVALADPRVAAVAAIDFYAVVSLRYLLRSHRRRLLDVKSWSSLLRGKSPALRRIVGGVFDIARRKLERRAETKSADGLMPVKSPAMILAELERVNARGCELLFAYAQGAPSYDQYLLHFKRGMRELAKDGRLRVETFAQADHVFTLLKNRAQLVDGLVAWVDGIATRQAPLPSRDMAAVQR